MNKLEQLHLDAIENNLEWLDKSKDKYSEAASKSAEITEQIAIEFAVWCAKNYVPILLSKELKCWQKDNYQNKERFYSTQELFQEFLKTKQ